MSKILKYLSQNPISSFGWLFLALGIFCVSNHDVEALTIGIFGIIIGAILIVSSYKENKNEYNRHVKYLEDDAQKQIKILNEYTLSIEKNPEDPDNYFYRGVFNYRNKDYNSAIKDFLVVTKINPNHEEALSYIAECKKEVENYSNSNSKL